MVRGQATLVFGFVFWPLVQIWAYVQRTAQTLRDIAFEDLGSFAAPLKQAGYDIE